MSTTRDISDEPPAQVPISQSTSMASNDAIFDFLGLRIIIYRYLVEPEWHTMLNEQPEEDKATKVRRLIKAGTKFSNYQMRELWRLESEARKMKAEGIEPAKPDPRPRLAVRIPNYIPPVHLTCRALLEETRKYLKPLVEPTRLPRILFRSKDLTHDYEQDLGDLLYDLDDYLDKRDRGKLTPLVKDEICSTRKLNYSQALQLFAERTLKVLPKRDRREDNVFRQANPLHLVLQSRFGNYQWQSFTSTFAVDGCEDHRLAVHMYSMAETQKPFRRNHRGWFEYKGVLRQEAWDAEWA